MLTMTMMIDFVVVVVVADNDDLCLPQLLAVPLEQSRVGVRCSCCHCTTGEISLIPITF